MVSYLAACWACSKVADLAANLEFYSVASRVEHWDAQMAVR